MEMCLKLAYSAFSSSPSKDSTRSSLWGFLLHYLFKFKPLDDFSLPKRDCKSLCVCDWSVCGYTRTRWIKISLKLSLALFISTIFKRWSLLSFFSLCWSLNCLKCAGHCLFLSYCDSCSACEKSFLTGKECPVECAHWRSPRPKKYYIH